MQPIRIRWSPFHPSPHDYPESSHHPHGDTRKSGSISIDGAEIPHWVFKSIKKEKITLSDSFCRTAPSGLDWWKWKLFVSFYHHHMRWDPDESLYYDSIPAINNPCEDKPNKEERWASEYAIRQACERYTTHTALQGGYIGTWPPM